MSHSSEEADERKVEAASKDRMQEEVGPSGHQPSRQGYCGYCRLLYSNLDQHLSSLKHLKTIQATGRDPCVQGSAPSTITSSVMLERFLQDVMLHHPHHYQDPRPPYVDLPSDFAPRLSWLQVPDRPPESDETLSLSANQGADSRVGQQTEAGPLARLHAPIKEKDSLTTRVENKPISCGKAEAPPPQTQPPSSVHRKAHRKTNRRKSSDLFPSSTSERWQKAQQDALFFPDSVGQTMEEVIHRVCHGCSSSISQQEELKGLQVSLPVSPERQSDDWDSAVQVGLQTPVRVSQSTRQEITCMMDIQVLLENQVYQDQLHSALYLSGDQVKRDQAPPLELQHTPKSFRGKSWAQIQQEDEKKVEQLVHQFRRHTFTCYFDSESLTRYGRRSRGRARGVQEEGEAPSPLDARDEEEVVGVARRKRGRSFKIASRCQVVKVSRSTQTVCLLIPEVRLANQVAPAPSADEDAEVAVTPMSQRPAGGRAWRCLPSRYVPVVTQLQPRASLLLLLAPPPGSVPLPHPLATHPGFAHSLTPSSTPRRCRKKQRPQELQGSKVKYKQLAVRFYNPDSHRILKAPPVFTRTTPSCRRQLFRSLSPDLNAHRPQRERPPKVKGQRCSAILLSTLSQKSEQADPRAQSEVAEATTRRPRPLRLRLLAAKTPSRTEGLPAKALPRREGLRRTGSSGQSSADLSPRGRRRGRTGQSFRKHCKKTS